TEKMASLIREVHPLTLKVMRLSRPTLSETHYLPLDATSSILSQPLRELSQSQPTASGQVYSNLEIDHSGALDALPVSETLVLPRTFGTMYLGETFTAQLCICNESGFTVRDISIQVVMQTGTQQTGLFDSTEESAGIQRQPQQLAAGQAFNRQVVHEIKELGAHVLGCTIGYLSAQGERRVLQRSFKFQAANPLVVKTKVNHLDRDVLLEVQVHNATQGALALERLRFDPAQPFAVRDLNSLGDGSPVWGSQAGFMQPGDVRQYLYRLQAQDAEPLTVERERAIRYATALGKLDILWRGAFGSTGRLQTSQLLRKSPGMFLIEIEEAEVVGNSEKRAVVEQPFVARVRVRNVSEQRMDVVAAVNMQRNPSVVACGPMQVALGAMEVGEVKSMDLELVPLASGVLRVGAVAFVDNISGYTREVDHLLDVAVSS
ncbi:hypothetical protein GGI07_001791, partial [Coemansia sp. Benny D115]